MSKAKSNPFAIHVQDLLAPLGGVELRAMFGGHGVYQDGLMFGLLARDELYLKVDAENIQRFLDAKLDAFVVKQGPSGSMEMSYRRAPEGGLDDGELLRDWARGSIAAAHRAHAAKTTAKKKPAKAAAKKVPTTKRATTR